MQQKAFGDARSPDLLAAIRGLLLTGGEGREGEKRKGRGGKSEGVRGRATREERKGEVSHFFVEVYAPAYSIDNASPCERHMAWHRKSSRGVQHSIPPNCRL